ncbi:methyl-accepting chemotaxis protein [Exiguobacterium artemiae]|uniref:methyl-accepting chemotaxis protein n=1 Tax=Exiguobacterium artemiae TaxID=340145 RepID=UPI002963E601|nr:methyl-accepting chemotaxis protein [Exiguobacterium sibiricum]MDW2884441.1 methyl-accepting chemotaxis protein [Exiguobacterium sibiricum]
MRLPITRRLFIGLILLPALTLGVSTWFSYNQTSQTVERLVDSTSQTALKQLEQSFSRIIDDTKKDTTLLAGLPFNRTKGQLPSYISNTPEAGAELPSQKAKDIYSVLEKYGSSKIENSFVQYADTKGGYLNWPKQEAASGYDPRQDVWYKQALENSSTVAMSEPYYDQATKLSVIGFSKAALDDQANIKGVLSVYKSVDRLSEDMKRIEIGQKGFVFSYTKDGQIVTHPNKNYFFKKVDQLREDGKAYFEAPKQMISQESGSTIMEVGGKKSVVIWQLSSKTGFKLAVVLDYASLYAPKDAMLTQSLINFVIAIALATLIAWLIGRSINRPLAGLRSEALAIASGDLRTTTRPKRWISDELSDLGENFDAMRQKLRQTITAMTQSAGTVRDASHDLSSNAVHVQNASVQIGQTMEEIAAAGETQTKQAERSSHAVYGVKERSIAMQTAATETLTEVASVASAATRGSRLTKQTITDLLQHSDSLEQEIQNTSDFLGKRSEEIGKILGTLQAISSQTNLLALNAAIEAARVGEQGRGFAVVASEVRKLAEESDQSAKQIKQLLDNIQHETQTAMGAMNGVMDDLKQSLESVKTTGVDFEQIAGSVQHVSNRTESLTGDISALTHATEEVSDAMGTILALTEENAAGIETSAASIQETNATIEAVTTAAAHLAQIATELHALTVDFQVDEPIDGDELLAPAETPEPLVHDLSYDEVAAASLDERAETEQTSTDDESADPADSDSSDDAHR